MNHEKGKVVSYDGVNRTVTLKFDLMPPVAVWEMWNVETEYEILKERQSGMKRFCKICGKSEDNHHEPLWIQVPKGCVCDLLSWDENLDKIPDPCGKYQGNGFSDCKICGHEKECHEQ